MTTTIAERPARVLPGLPMLVLTVLLGGGAVALFAIGGTRIADSGMATGPQIVIVAIGVLMLICAVLIPLGLFIVEPNHATVIILFGRYKGTERRDGWFWTNPFTVGSRDTISLRIRNFDTERVKVNDSRGNPIQIAAVVVWRVVETAKATFHVDDYENFVKVQSETAVRHLATQHPYDGFDEEGVFSLTGNVEEVSRTLQVELEARLLHAGVDVVETRLSHLSYSPEIAQAMLRRQQASAIVAARRQMVEGAVGMVDMALTRLSEENIVQLDEERKAAMISNLLVVLTGEQAVHPVVNTGSLYQ